jgi:TonB family protein
METSVINRDLARWSKRHWVWCVFILFSLQLGVLFFATLPLKVRLNYASDPVMEVPSRSASKSSGDWLALEDPMLFAAPAWHGVSGEAWMKKPRSVLTLDRGFPAIRYLGYRHSGPLGTGNESVEAALWATHRRPPPRPLLPVLPLPMPAPASRLVTEGFGERLLIQAPELPKQFHTDAVGRTILQAAIDPDGVVLSRRVIAPSGSKRADADALALTRALRFEPLRTFSDRAPEIAWGKLIFEWHALDLNSTNAVGP